MFRANITQSTLTPEMSAYLDALATRAKAGKSAAEAPPAHTARVAPAAPEPAPKGRSRKARGDTSTSEGRRPALNLIGSYDPVDQSAIIAADDVVAFVAPSYVTRTPIRYDELCRLLHRLAGSGESVECLANAFGLGEDDVTRAVALWKRHLGRRKSNA